MITSGFLYSYYLLLLFFTCSTWGNLNSVVHIINALTLTCFGSDVVLKQDETPLLYSLVFGGGLVNDASSVVLFNAIKKLDLSHYFNRCHSVSSKLLSFVLEKHITGNCSKSLSNKLLFLSGILSVFFCGVVMSHYTSWNNGNGSSKLIPRHAFATLSFVAEIFIFLCVGMDALDIEKWNVVRESHGKSVGASFILLGLVLVGRAAFVFPLSFITNLTRKHKKRPYWFAIWWAGLMRGAASVALAYHQTPKFGLDEN
ncbi:Sodium/hydrogen exchanger 2 -like protein [Cucumis melo var. makuwa]|uniref:Sodium/hydrogen exchanger 2-like protein n=1 Tax=Cucumis melo var. makuwa TaxID=1194695 RepID=A0A5A7US92_CUCMM|nr:Sodium/hydrogen exchanger 2 -like protein [Cucumis melo var. makuwa]